MTSSESSTWDLAAIVEVLFEDRIQCQCRGCGRVVYKQVHIIVWTDGRIECWGGGCYGRELGATPRGRATKPIYRFADGRRLTPEERQLLKNNREQLIAEFRREQESEEQAGREAEENGRRAAEEHQRCQSRRLAYRDHGLTLSPLGDIRDQEAVCEKCGRRTSDWWFYDGRTGTCECRDCQRQAKMKPEGTPGEEEDIAQAH